MLQKLTPFRSRMQRGIALIESLVAIVVMALGILGILGVQMRTLADTQTGVRRAQAIRLIEDLSERIQTSPNGLGGMEAYALDWKSKLSDSTECETKACDNTKLAAYNVAVWINSVRRALPLSDATIFLTSGETDASNRRQLGVMISWRENEKTKADGTKDTDYLKAFETAKTAENNSITCPEGSICHLQYIQPIARCSPRDVEITGTEDKQVYCP